MVVLFDSDASVAVVVAIAAAIGFVFGAFARIGRDSDDIPSAHSGLSGGIGFAILGASLVFARVALTHDMWRPEIEVLLRRFNDWLINEFSILGLLLFIPLDLCLMLIILAAVFVIVCLPLYVPFRALINLPAFLRGLLIVWRYNVHRHPAEAVIAKSLRTGEPIEADAARAALTAAPEEIAHPPSVVESRIKTQRLEALRRRLEVETATTRAIIERETLQAVKKRGRR